MSTASLEMELSRQRQINSELRMELSEIESGVSRGERDLEDLNNKICRTLDESARLLRESHDLQLRSIELQGEIDRLYVRFKQMELANKKIRECNNKKYYEFGNYRRVRKLVQGMMDNLDHHMVSDAVIYKSVEKQQLQSPDFWLTCCLIAIMGWKNDEKELSDRALAIALGLDKKKTAIFMMLFNLRAAALDADTRPSRENAALEWFCVYQECPQQGRDQRTFLTLFSLMGNSSDPGENVNAEMRQEIQDYIERTAINSQEADGYDVGKIVETIEGYYNRMDSRSAEEYPLLKKYSSAFGTLAFVLKRAKGNISILEFLRQVMNVRPAERNILLKEYVDEVISQPNAAEIGVEDEIRYNELIISCTGDVEEAKRKYEAGNRHDSKELNLVMEMVDWIFDVNNEDISTQSRLNMFIMTKNLHRQAIEGHFESYRKVNVNTLPVTINDYTSTVDFRDIGGEKQKISSFYYEKKNAALAAVKDWPAYIGFGVGLLCAVGAFALWMLPLLIGTAIGAALGAFKLLTNRSERKQQEMLCANNITAACDILDHLAEEHQRYLQELDSYDGYEKDINEELDNF